MKKVISALLLTAILVTAVWAPAAQAEAVRSEEIYSVIDFKFHHYEYGIGYGNCPVYSAPSTSAFRCANGKASCDTNYDMWIAGFDQGSGWLMVRYEINNGGWRVGYIPKSSIPGFKTTIDPLKFSYIPQTAMGTIDVTDNPLTVSSSFARLHAGGTYHILGKYTYYGNWWYIEFTVNGQVARGFINRTTTPVDNGSGVYSTDIGYPSASPFGGEQIGTATIIGDARIVREKADPNTEMVARVNSYEQYPVYGSQIGSTGKLWYYIYVDGVWGWISSSSVRFE